MRMRLTTFLDIVLTVALICIAVSMALVMFGAQAPLPTYDGTF